LVAYANGIIVYILSINTLDIGQRIINTSDITLLKTGDSTQLFNMRSGYLVHSVENLTKIGGVYVRCASNFAKILSNINNLTLLKLRSGFIFKISNRSVVTYGAIQTQVTSARHRKASYFLYKG
jgi:ribosomal protein L2